MKVRRPLKYVLIVAGLAAGWAAGGALDGRDEQAPPPRRDVPRPNPQTVPTTSAAAQITLVPSPGNPGEGASVRPALSIWRAQYNHRPFDVGA